MGVPDLHQLSVFVDFTRNLPFMRSTILCDAPFYAKHHFLQSTIWCKAPFCAMHHFVQSTTLSETPFWAKHYFVRSTSLCEAPLCSMHIVVRSTILFHAPHAWVESEASAFYLFQNVLFYLGNALKMSKVPQPVQVYKLHNKQSAINYM